MTCCTPTCKDPAIALVPVVSAPDGQITACKKAKCKVCFPEHVKFTIKSMSNQDRAVYFQGVKLIEENLGVAA